MNFKDVVVITDGVTEESLLSSIWEQSQLNQDNLHSICARVCLQMVEEQQAHHNEFSAPHSIAKILRVIGSLQYLESFDRSEFTKLMCDTENLPLYFIWKLHLEDIVPLDTYVIRNEGNSVVMDRLCGDLTQAMMDGPVNSTPTRGQLISDLVGFLVNNSFEREVNSQRQQDFSKISIALLDNITNKLLDWYDRKIELGTIGHVCLYEVLNNSTAIDKHSLKNFYIHQLSVIFRYKPVYKVLQAFSLQRSWNYRNTKSYMINLYQQLILPLDALEIVTCLEESLTNEDVNWKLALSFVSTFVVSVSEAPDLIQDVADKCIRSGCTDLDQEQLSIGLLLIRQAAIEGHLVFIPYQQWFKGMLCGEESPAKSRKTFSFLVRLLSNLVPFEPADIIKVHIGSLPYIPPKCRAVWSDYLALAKTRLVDLNEPLHQTLQGRLDLRTSNTEQEVKEAVDMFSSTGKIPATIIEASIFRKPTYIGEILPTLLKPKILPSKPDARMEFIEALRRCDKIPATLYENYKKACQGEAALLVEGIEYDDDDIDAMLLVE